jgi:hypothetical protein
MNEASSALSDKDRDVLKQQLAEGTAEINAQHEHDVQELGKVVAKPVVTINGDVLTPGDITHEHQYRQVHGHPIQQLPLSR